MRRIIPADNSIKIHFDNAFFIHEYTPFRQAMARVSNGRGFQLQEYSAFLVSLAAPIFNAQIQKSAWVSI